MARRAWNSRGRYLRVWLPSEYGPLPLNYTKTQALALLNRLERKGAA